LNVTANHIAEFDQDGVIRYRAKARKGSFGVNDRVQDGIPS
jgi:hypothetical protein